MSTISSCLGVFALELSPGTCPAHTVLDQSVAGELACLIARDLAAFIGSAADLDLVLLAGLFDPVELLRPYWPLHAELERIVAQAPDNGAPRVIAIGAHDGQLPELLCPHPDYQEGSLRLLPFLLRGDAAAVAKVGALFEQTLLDTGMAEADTALFAQEAFGACVEHARYLTTYDLAAMTAMQYDNVGLGALWPLIETALLSPDEEQWLDAPPEPIARFAQGQVRIALFDCETWAQNGFTTIHNDKAKRSRAFDQFEMRQRQIAAVLQAHGIPVTFDYCPIDQDARAILSA